MFNGMVRSDSELLLGCSPKAPERSQDPRHSVRFFVLDIAKTVSLYYNIQNDTVYTMKIVLLVFLISVIGVTQSNYTPGPGGCELNDISCNDYAGLDCCNVTNGEECFSVS